VVTISEAAEHRVRSKEAAFMSDGKRIEQMIYDWLERNYPEAAIWYDHDEKDISPALEIRMISAFDAVEYNLGNGGWAQFLWNCFPHWRAIIVVAKEGYRLIGAPEQSDALDKLYALCERDERECAEMRRKSVADHDVSDDSYPSFAAFTSRSYSAPASDWEGLFWDKALYEKRLAWLAANEARVRKAIEVLD
jgi:hypothetical protein